MSIVVNHNVKVGIDSSKVDKYKIHKQNDDLQFAFVQKNFYKNNNEPRNSMSIEDLQCR